MDFRAPGTRLWRDWRTIATMWPVPGSEDTELGVFMGPEVCHGAKKVYA
jgi:hypothetical protein